MPAPASGPPSGARPGSRTTQRRGRMSDAKRASLVDLGPRWMVAEEEALDPSVLVAAFGRQAPRLLDVGGGTGDATLAWAEAHPDHDLVALELHRPGIVQLVRRLEADGPANVRVAEADVTRLLPGPHPGSLAGIRVLFPDPWPKRRHLDRRLVDAGFVRAATDLLAVGGVLHLATDWPPYADQMRLALAADHRLDVEVVLDADEGAGEQVAIVAATDVATVAPPPPEPGLPPPWRSPRPARPVTRYEQRGLDAGRPIVDLVARRRR